MTNLIKGLGRHPQTVGLALVIVIGLVLLMELLSAYLPMLGNPLVLVAGSFLALVLLFGTRISR
jgi:hypothetical protein